MGTRKYYNGGAKAMLKLWLSFRNLQWRIAREADYNGGARAMLKLWLSIRNLQWSIAREADGSDFDDKESEVSKSVPDDVKEGHFAVFAVMGSERKRFVVEIERLTSPAFLRLLDKAEEEYGFEQTGAISVPCRPEDLQKIL